MATVLYTILGITAGASLHCAVRREISPCTCAPHDILSNTIVVTCERMESFGQVVEALQDRFMPEHKIWLRITHSQLDDLGNRTFDEMRMQLKNLRLSNDNLSTLPVSTFRGLSKTEFLSLPDNNFEEIPYLIFEYMPSVWTLDLARGFINSVRTKDFKALPNLRHLVLAQNQISRLEAESFPTAIVNLHLGLNNLTTLNGTIRNLPNLKILFVNANNLTSLEDELPPNSRTFIMLLAQYNRLEYLPTGFRKYPNLDSLYIYNNELKTLGGNLKYATKLKNLWINCNRIEYLAEDEFADAESIEDIYANHNFIPSLNGSLIPVKALQYANFSFNLLTEFALRDIAGLTRLRILDLSNNQISKLVGRFENQIEPNSLLVELHLEHNELVSLDGALMGLIQLKKLDLSHNRLKTILPEDLIGLENLEHLDVSYNQIMTLQETSKAFLPSLNVLNASYNLITALDKDFYGLPVLCVADFSNNMIVSISPDLVAHTRCTTHKVVNKLEIILQENPILCDNFLPELVAFMEYQHARLMGVAHCLVPQQMPIDRPILLQAQPTFIQKQIPINNPVMNPPPSIVQVIVPVAAGPLLPAPQALIQPPDAPAAAAQIAPILEIPAAAPIPTLVFSSTTPIPLPYLSSTYAPIEIPTTTLQPASVPVPIVAEKLAEAVVLPTVQLVAQNIVIVPPTPIVEQQPSVKIIANDMLSDSPPTSVVPAPATEEVTNTVLPLISAPETLVPESEESVENTTNIAEDPPEDVPKTEEELLPENEEEEEEVALAVASAEQQLATNE